MHIHVRTWLFLAFLLQVVEFSSGYNDAYLERVKEKMLQENGVNVDISAFKDFISRGKLIDVVERATVGAEGETNIGDRRMRSREDNEADAPGYRKRRGTRSAMKRRRSMQSGKKMSGSAGKKMGKKGGTPGNPDFCPPWAPTSQEIDAALAAFSVGGSGKKGSAAGGTFPGENAEQLFVQFNITQTWEENFFGLAQPDPPGVPDTADLEYTYGANLFIGDPAVLTGTVAVVCIIQPLRQDGGICNVDIQLFNFNSTTGGLTFVGLVAANGFIFIDTLNGFDFNLPLDGILPNAGGRGLCGLDRISAIEFSNNFEEGEFFIYFTPANTPLVFPDFITPFSLPPTAAP
mmetsp:Transcript_17849/g.23630  ORF Transcript_17849/g.23630 Transcript_17849/m.23630 type:complete len:347 (-) Transcript_17849:203-1243(-)